MEEIIKNHLGEPTELEINGKDNTKTKFKLSPLKVKDIARLYGTFKLMKGVSEDTPTEMMHNLTPEIMETIEELGFKALKPNYPDVPDEQLREIVMRNAFLFITKLWEVNMNLGDTKEIGELKRRRTIKRLKEKANA